MRKHSAREFIDALIAGRRPPRFHASPARDIPKPPNPVNGRTS